MKVKMPNGVEIECTPDEFEELYTRGLLGGMGTGSEQDLWAENLKKIRDAKPFDIPGTTPYVPPKDSPYTQPRKWPRPWDTVTVMYGVTTDGPWAQGNLECDFSKTTTFTSEATNETTEDANK